MKAPTSRRVVPLRASLAVALLAACLSGLNSHEATAQGVGAVPRVEFSVDESGSVVINYDLVSTGGASDFFRISVQVSTDGGQTFAVTPRLVSGDVGPGVRPGTGKRIVWNVRDDVKRLQGDEVVFKVLADVESEPGFVDPPEMRTYYSLEARHRHGSGLLSVEASSSLHPVRLLSNSRTLIFDPLVEDGSQGQTAKVVCGFRRFVWPLESVSAKMVHLGPGRFDGTGKTGPGGETGDFLEVLLTEPGDPEKTMTMHLQVGVRPGLGPALPVLGFPGSPGAAFDPVDPFLRSLEAARRRQVPRGADSDDVSVRDLLGRVTTAVGGADLLRTVRDTSTSAVFRRLSWPGPGDAAIGVASVEAGAGRRFRQETTLRGETNVIVWDGRDVWRQAPGKRPTRMEEPSARAVKIQSVYFDTSNFADTWRPATVRGQVDVGPRVAWRLEQTVEGGSRVWADVDAETALPLRFGLASKGVPLMETEVFDYVRFGDVRAPRRSVAFVNGAPVSETIVQSIRFNTGISAERFKLSR